MFNATMTIKSKKAARFKFNSLKLFGDIIFMIDVYPVFELWDFQYFIETKF